MTSKSNNKMFNHIWIKIKISTLNQINKNTIVSVMKIRVKYSNNLIIFKIAKSKQFKRQLEWNRKVLESKLERNLKKIFYIKKD